MKIVTLIVRVLLGLAFVVFGLNGFLNFLNIGPVPTGLAGQFIGALFLSHYYWAICALQILGGALLLVNRFCAAGISAAWPSDRKHSLVSCVPESGWHKNGNYCDDPLVHCFLQQSPALLRDLCATDIRL